MSVYTYPSKKALASITTKVRALTKKARHHGLADLLEQLNLVIRGWCSYFRQGVSKATLGYLEPFAWHRVTQWLLKRHSRITWAELFRRFLTGRARGPSGNRGDRHVRHDHRRGHPLSVAGQHPHTVVGHRGNHGFRIAVEVRGAPDAMRVARLMRRVGRGKRARSNPGTAPRSAPYIIGVSGRSAIATPVERPSRFVMLAHLRDVP